MEPTKFEKHIREQLQERELSPSATAWGNLSQKLDKEMPQKDRRNYTWMAIAASFVGLLLVSTFLFPEKENTSEIVEANKEEVPESSTENKALETLIEINEAVGENNTKEEKSITNKEKNTGVSVKSTQQTTIAATKIAKEQVLVTPLEKEDLFMESKLNEVVSSVQELQNNNKNISPDEIDALLAKAQREISNYKILKKNIQKVDAAALLMDVEVELERSFRDKVFDVLGSGFNKVRTAMSARNQ